MPKANLLDNQNYFKDNLDLQIYNINEGLKCPHCSLYMNIKNFSNWQPKTCYVCRTNLNTLYKIEANNDAITGTKQRIQQLEWYNNMIITLNTDLSKVRKLLLKRDFSPSESNRLQVINYSLNRATEILNKLKKTYGKGFEHIATVKKFMIPM